MYRRTNVTLINAQTFLRTLSLKLIFVISKDVKATFLYAGYDF